jgi:F-type H+-transporting ATPase subunit epsilon
MRLTVSTPVAVVVDQDARKVAARGLDGAFVLLPRHIDLVAPLEPGVLAFVDANGAERFVGHDDATLVKEGERVRVAARRATVGEDLDKLAREVREVFAARDEPERRARSALARLEATIVRRFMEIEKR